MNNKPKVDMRPDEQFSGTYKCSTCDKLPHECGCPLQGCYYERHPGGDLPKGIESIKSTSDKAECARKSSNEEILQELMKYKSRVDKEEALQANVDSVQSLVSRSHVETFTVTIDNIVLLLPKDLTRIMLEYLQMMCKDRVTATQHAFDTWEA